MIEFQAWEATLLAKLQLIWVEAIAELEVLVALAFVRQAFEFTVLTKRVVASLAWVAFAFLAS